MRDADLRALARAVDEGRAPREKLELEWRRSGLGWHGEKVPETLRPAEEHGVYQTTGTDDMPAEHDLVYVAGGELRCPDCRGSGGIHHERDSSNECRPCAGVGSFDVEPFYMGRYPITWRDWGSFASATRHTGAFVQGWVDSLRGGLENTYHPAVMVSHDDVLAFCAWAAFRLPTAREWRYASGIGQPIPCVCRERGQQGACSADECYGKGTTVRKFPWGRELPTSVRCVSKDSPYHAPDGVANWPENTDSVVECEHCSDGRCYMRQACAWTGEGDAKGALVPARPLGASWCAVHDMAGHVWQFDSDGGAWGGSFRDGPRSDQLARYPHGIPDGAIVEACWPGGRTERVPATNFIQPPSDDLGFRVVLDAK